MFDQIINFINQHNLIPENSKIVIGLSGGPDSIFLMHFLNELKKERNLTLIAAHLDHEWREGSEKDAKFCQEASEKLSIEFIHGKAGELGLDQKFKGSQEERGRLMRRHFLETVKKDYKADLIALGHHEQDQQETFFIRLIRGTTLAGLVGMKPKRGMYIRPLLETSKEAIVNYLKEHNIKYLIDPTNIEESFLRNRIRAKVLPALRECDARFDKNFLRTLHNLQEADQFLQELITQRFKEIATVKEGVQYLDLAKLLALDDFQQNRIILHWLITAEVPFSLTETFLAEIKRYLKEGDAKEHQVHQTWAIVKEKGNVFIKKVP